MGGGEGRRELRRAGWDSYETSSEEDAVGYLLYELQDELHGSKKRDFHSKFVLQACDDRDKPVHLAQAERVCLSERMHGFSVKHSQRYADNKQHGRNRMRSVREGFPEHPIQSCYTEIHHWSA